jgi:site-specific recombinase XerD
MAIRSIIDPRRGKLWQISYCDGEGKRRREKFATRNAAEDAMGRRRREIAEGRYIPPRHGVRLTFRALASAAFAQKKLRLAPTSYATDLLRIKQVYPLIGNLPAQALTPARVEETLAALKSTGISNSTVNRFRALISSIYKFAEHAGRISANPVKKVKPYKENPSRVRWLKPDEEEILRDSFVEDSNEWEFELALYTGMRRGEQFGLQWANVDFQNKRLTVKGKTGERRIRLNSKALAALRKLETLTGKKKFVSPDAADDVKRDGRRWFEKACEKAGVENFHWHDLRHTFASRLVMNGADLVSVKELLGHADIKMTMKYAHLAPSHLDDAVEKMVEEPA